MSRNKLTVERYIEGFRRSDHAQILSCLTDDVVWDIPGAVHLVGKAAFDGEIENDAFVGPPTITIGRVIEEDDVVVAEGAVEATRRDGGVLHEENQPAHLLITDTEVCITRCTEEYGNPCFHFCPAQVYEPQPTADGRGKVPFLNFTNCFHCKTCDIMDPYQVITWVPPEGGGGPDYKKL